MQIDCDSIVNWEGAFIGKHIFILTNFDNCLFKSYQSPLVQVETYRLKEFFTIHSNSNFISYNLTEDILKIESASEFRFSELYNRSQVTHLKLLFQLVSLATKGDLFAPESIWNLSTTLNERKLHCSILIENESSPDDIFKILQVCYEYLEWKISSMSAKNRLTHDIQAKAEYALRKVESFGYKLSKEKVDNLYKKTELEIIQRIKNLGSLGWSSGYRSVWKYEEIVRSLKIELPTTATGKVSSAERHIVEHAEKHPFFREYLDFHSLRKLKSTYISKMKDTDILFPHFKTLVSTGRTSSYNPNFQNFPKDREVRECFIPREGHIFLVADYATIELCALAQTCVTLFGQSRMADLINSGVDLHRWFASVLLNKSPDLVTKEERTYAKACNFGFPGGLGVKQFLEYAKYTYGISSLTQAQASAFKGKWLEAFPEMNRYLDANGQRFRSKAVATTITGRIRSNCTFTQAKNFPFQGLASDGGKLALYELIQAEYRVINYIHDEFVLELPSNDFERMNERVSLAESIMIDQMKVVCPDLKIGVESKTCEFWEKL